MKKRSEKSTKQKLQERYRVVVQYVIYRGNPREYLIMRRTGRHTVWPHRWTLPGGGVDRKKDFVGFRKKRSFGQGVLYRAGSRESLEEAGIEVGVPRYLDNASFVRPDGIYSIFIVFAARHVGGCVKLKRGDCSEFKWVRAGDIQKYRVIGIAGECIRRMGDHYRLSKRSRKRKRKRPAC